MHRTFLLTSPRYYVGFSFMKQTDPDLKTGDIRKASTKNARGGADDALWAGHLAGKAAELNHGVSGQEQGKLSYL